MKRNRSAAMIAVAAVATVGLGAGAAITACGSAGQLPAAASAPGGAAYSYYQSMMRRLDSGQSGSPGSMMGGAFSGSMMGGTAYRSMMGGLAAPAWMRGHVLPGLMMGSSSDAGKVMGGLFANALGARVAAARAASLGSQVPAGATVRRAGDRITFSGMSIRLAVVASPAGGPDETFRIAGLVDPAIVVKAGAHVSIEVVNADSGSAHGLVVTAGRARFSRIPMMTASPAFPGSGAVVPRQPHLRGHARRNAQFHGRRARGLPLPVPRPRARAGRHGRGVHRQRHRLSSPVTAATRHRPGVMPAADPGLHFLRRTRPGCAFPAMAGRRRRLGLLLT